MRYIATCKMGLESVVSEELRAKGIEIESVSDARIVFRGDGLAMARACLWLRSAERVLMIAGEFKAASFEELYEGVRRIEWERYIRKDSFIHVNGKSAKSTLFAVSDCQRITKKAIVDRLFEAYHTANLPETGEEIIIEVGHPLPRLLRHGPFKTGLQDLERRRPHCGNAWRRHSQPCKIPRGDPARRSHVRLRHDADRGSHDRKEHGSRHEPPLRRRKMGFPRR